MKRPDPDRGFFVFLALLQIAAAAIFILIGMRAAA